MLLLLLLAFLSPPIDISAECIVITGTDATTGTVSVVLSKPADETAILGTWVRQDKVLTFTPRFAFEPGTQYRVVVADSVNQTFILPSRNPQLGKLLEIQPSSRKLPSNTLRFYLHFDQEMKQGQGYQHFELLDAKGVAVKSPFLILDEELWSDDGKRFTLLFDPGRVKQELVPRKEQGPVLESGKEYTLVVRKEFKTLAGQPLTADFKKSITVTSAYDTALDPSIWTITAPKANSKQPIELRFDRILDHALLGRVMTIEDAGGKAIAGSVTFDSDDSHWLWTPKQDWAKGDYRIVIQGVLEDVCGNRIGAAFDSQLGEIGARHLKPPTKLKFSVK